MARFRQVTDSMAHRASEAIEIHGEKIFTIWQLRSLARKSSDGLSPGVVPGTPAGSALSRGRGAARESALMSRFAGRRMTRF
jgi:hypothetical protein